MFFIPSITNSTNASSAGELDQKPLVYFTRRAGPFTVFKRGSRGDEPLRRAARHFDQAVAFGDLQRDHESTGGDSAGHGQAATLEGIILLEDGKRIGK